MYKNILVTVALLIFVKNFALAQSKYPQGYFSWPVKAPVGIVANFGELRPNHYHMGLDVRTNQRQNIPVVAAAAGYIAKVKIEPWGFGRAIYINHPNGLTTLYAHLNNFYPALETYITNLQYKTKSWEQFVDIPANLFIVQQNDLIAYSGNTGGSQGPHVHFEIRDTKSDKVLNPLLFGFALADNVPPKLSRLALYDRCKSTYEQAPRFIPISGNGKNYKAATIIANTDKVSFAIGATDAMNATPNPNGIYSATIYDNGVKNVAFTLDSIDYTDTRYLNANIDHKTKFNGGPWLQHVAKLDGYPVGTYQPYAGNGVILLTDDQPHQIKIVVQDAYGNSTTLEFAVQRKLGYQTPPIKDSALVGKKILFTPTYGNIYEGDFARCYLPEGAIYDSFRFTYSYVKDVNGNPIHTLHTPAVPVHTSFPVSLRQTCAQPNKMVMRRFWYGKQDFKKPTIYKDWYTANFKSLGNYQLIEDTEAPKIQALGITNGANLSKAISIKFKITDNTEDLTFEALLDDQWLRFSYDKGEIFIYQFDDKCTPGPHTLKIKATDCVGNTTTATYNFTR
jgi:murein DD-endopeptidase MepM/ murein hydrolase activator NlpD